MIWTRERYLAHCDFEDTGREMLVELFRHPVIGLLDEWKAQGATKDELDRVAFDWDYVLRTDMWMHCEVMSGIIPYITEDNPEYQYSIDRYGRKSKLCKTTATIPLPTEYPVTCMEDWLKIKHWYEYNEKRIDREILQKHRNLWDKGYLTVLYVPGAFDEPRQMLGEEELCVMCYEEPELLHDMLDTISDMCVKVIERIAEIVPIEQVSIHEDMAGKSGPLFGPKQVREFMQPYYQKIWKAAKQAGAKQFSQDSDGNMNPIIQDILDCGVTCIYPCEPAAGMDIVEIREKYGTQVVLKGGIDKLVLRENPQAIRKELEYKLQESMLHGGAILGIDHQIPNGTSIENYRYYAKTVREILGMPPATEKCWGPMAF